jgi:hypothetical protein
MIRDDLSDKLIHLTRGRTDDEAADLFAKIVGERILRGGQSWIKGRFKS